VHFLSSALLLLEEDCEDALASLLVDMSPGTRRTAAGELEVSRS
jgi:hypothetical protein